MTLLAKDNNSVPQLKEWLDRLAPVVEDARTTLQHRPPGKIVMYSGCKETKDGDFRLQFFGKDYIVKGDDFTIQQAGSGEEPSSFTQSLILSYLATASGTTPSRRWIGFRELPDGMFYTQAFRGYTGIRLIRELEGGIEAFQRGAEAIGGQAMDEIGDASYRFEVLPRVHIALVYWQGDEDFPSQARVLFEDTAPDYMSTDGLAILGSQLVGRVLEAAQQ